MSRRKTLYPFVVLIVAGFGAFLLLATAPEVESVSPEEALPIVRAIEVRPGDVRMTVRSQGTVAPRTESNLVPEVSGSVVWISPALVSGAVQGFLGFFQSLWSWESFPRQHLRLCTFRSRRHPVF